MLLAGEASGWEIIGCTNTASPNKPCKKVTLAGGEAAKLTVGGVSVLLDSATATSDGTVPAMTIQAQETKAQAS